MSNIPADLRYTKEHEYIRATDEAAIVAIGITDFAQGELGDIVYVELPKIGATYGSHDVFGTVEAVKAVSELYMPVAGEVVEINRDIVGNDLLDDITGTTTHFDPIQLDVQFTAGRA